MHWNEKEQLGCMSEVAVSNLSVAGCEDEWKLLCVFSEAIPCLQSLLDP